MMISRTSFLIKRTFSTGRPLCKAAKPVSPSLLSLKVGQVLQCNPHPDADKLYVSSISQGSEVPLTVCSGLKDFILIEQMQHRRVVLLTNLKPAAMRGVTSEAMLLAAEKISGEGENVVVEGVELVEPPAEAEVGAELVWEAVEDDVERVDGEKIRLSPKAWKKIQKRLFTDGEGHVIYKGDESVHKLIVKGTDKPASVASAFNSVVR